MTTSSAPPAPTAAWVVACWRSAPRRRVTVQGDPEHPGQPRAAVLQGHGAGRRRWAWRAGCCIPEIDGRQVELGRGARPRGHRASPSASHEQGPDSVALYVSGQLLTEDYYVANKLMKGYHRHGEHRYQLAAVHVLGRGRPVRAFGEDVVPVDYTDLEAGGPARAGGLQHWPGAIRCSCSACSRRAKRRPGAAAGGDRSAPHGDLRMRRPAPAAAQWQRCAVVQRPAGVAGRRRRASTTAYVARTHRGLRRGPAGGARRPAPTSPPRRRPAASIAAAVRAVLQLVRRHHARVVTLFSQGVNQSSAGTDKVNSIINCHLLTGRIGQPGMGPFSITGQPNAMGGREVGGLATQLAAHLSLESPAHRAAVQEFWDSPRIAEQAGPQGRGAVRGHRRRAASRRCGSWPPIRW